MLPESEERAARLAVSRFGAEASKVRSLYQQARAAQTQGKGTDLLDILVQQKVLTAAQAQDLRLGLDATQIDPFRKAEPAANPPTNGTASGSSDSSVAGLTQLGEYRILRPIGEGGMGSVFLGYSEKDHRHVAIKVLPDALASNQGAIDRFHREAKSGALLNHPNIVRILGVGKDQATQRLYLVMEYVDGLSALQLLRRHGHLTVGDAVHLALDVARGLEHAHSRNIIHRDIKPDNILITQTGVAKLTDLGLAKRTDETSHLTAARQGFGTPYYMPYEQAVNAKHADGRSDIYALGATLYHLVAGEVPFQGKTALEIVELKSIGEFAPASSHNDKVPAALDAILARMLAREPADRYQTASELIVELERSGLAAPVPSFVDEDRALRDPVVRERLAASAQATAAELHIPLKETPAETRGIQADVWYLRYQDKGGGWCKAKATTEQVLKRIREHRFPLDVEASHHHHGEFQPLVSFTEFSGAIAETGGKSKKMRAATNGSSKAVPFANGQPSAAPAPNRSRVWVVATAGALAGLSGCLVLAKFLLGL
jgi:serine/threonine-protein kinase